jgi:chemotaxis protein methyltransferase CheR
MEEREYSFIRREVVSLVGVDLNCYKGAQMERRLNAYLSRSGRSTWSDFFGLLRDDPTELRKFTDYLTINVSSFLRDPEKYKHLQATILPELLRDRSALRVWSAGCSRGQEPYSLAMALEEVAGPNRRHYILATDIDRSALEWARAGGPYTNDDVANVPPHWLERYFSTTDNRFYVSDQLRRRITFRQNNLMADPFESGFDLIVCRNVVIYFTTEAKAQLYQRFYDSLRPGGVLFVGGTEIVSRASEIGFETAGISFYRRSGHSAAP